MNFAIGKIAAAQSPHQHPAAKERVLVRRARRLVAAIKGLLIAEKSTIDRAVEVERSAIVEGAGDAELRARKLNLLLQFQNVVKEQCEEMMPGDGDGGVIDFDAPPDTFMGKLEGKEDEASRIQEWLEDREDVLEAGQAAVDAVLRPQ